MKSVEVVKCQMALRERYTTIENTFKKKNLDTSFISTIVKYYEEDSEAKTRGMEMKAVRLEPSHICRVIVLPMDYDLTIAQKLFQASRKVMEVIPSHLKVSQIPAESLHVALFNASRPESLALPKNDADLQNYLVTEKQTAAEILKSSEKPHFVFDRIALADSGTLIAFWVDETEACFDIRKRLRAALPDAPLKQTNIIHSSLFRIITPSKLDKTVLNKVCKMCKKVSKELKGVTWIPRYGRYIHEQYYSTTEGLRFDFSLL